MWAKILLMSLMLFFESKLASAIDQNPSTYFFAESMPIFKGDLTEFIHKNIRYPQAALIDSVEGRVIVSFWADTDGRTINHAIIKGIRNDLNIEALRICKLIRFTKPAFQAGKPLRVYYTIYVDFKIPRRQ